MNNEPQTAKKVRTTALSFVDLFQLVRDYVKQETLDPLRGVGRWLAWGLIGSVFLLFGAVIGMLGVLRLLQAEIFFTHNGFTWAPYFIVAAIAMGLIVLCLTRIQRPSLHPEN